MFFFFIPKGESLWNLLRVVLSMKTHIKSSNFTDFSKQPCLQLIYYAVYLPWLHLIVDFITKLHRLPESVISNKEPQFTAELTKELNIIITYYLRMWKIRLE